MKMVKMIAAAAALTMASSAFAEVTFTAYNKISSDVVKFNHDDAADKTTKAFAGLNNKIHAEILTDTVDAMAQGVFSFADQTNRDDYGFKWEGAIDDWYVEVRCFDNLITLGYHDGIFAEGSYLPVYDDNVSSGNIGSEGFTVVYRPTQLDGLRIAASVPFGVDEVNYLSVENENEVDDTFDVRLGAIYDAGIAEFGVAVQDVADKNERTLGFFVYSAGLFGQVKGVNLRAGFTHSWDKGFGFNPIDLPDAGDAVIFNGENIWNVAFEVEELLPVALTVEAAGNTDSDNEAFDLYAGVKVACDINEQLALSVTGKVLTDLSSGDTAWENLYGANANLDFKVTEKDTVSAAADIVYSDSNWLLKFPVAWKHTF